jgi:hypothetical protein
LLADQPLTLRDVAQGAVQIVLGVDHDHRSVRDLVGFNRPGDLGQELFQELVRRLERAQQFLANVGWCANASQARHPGLLFGNPLLHLPDMQQSQL